MPPDPEGLDVHASRLPTLTRRARKVIPGGVNSGQRQLVDWPGLVITRASGSRIWDEAGKPYIDFHAAFGPSILGHAAPGVSRAVELATRSLDLPGVGITEGEITLAEQIVELFPSIHKVLLTSTGSEATFHAIRVARAATGRRLVVKFQGCYHGWHDSVSLNVISAQERIGHKDPISAGILPEVLNATLVLPFNDIVAVRSAFHEHGAEIAAVIIEPVAHNVGCLLPEQSFLAALRSETAEAGAVLIFDEVITGIRHDLGGWQSISGVTPDLTTLGKALANGYPLGAIGGRADLMDMFSTIPGAPVFFAGTYNGHPAAVAAALETLRVLKEEPVHEHIFALGQQARQRLTQLMQDLDVPAVVTGYGSVFVTYFMPGPRPRTYDDLLMNDNQMFVNYRHALRSYGVFELPLPLKRSHVSYAHTNDDIDMLIDGTRRAITRMLKSKASYSAGAPATMGGVSSNVNG